VATSKKIKLKSKSKSKDKDSLIKKSKVSREEKIDKAGKKKKKKKLKDVAASKPEKKGKKLKSKSKDKGEKKSKRRKEAPIYSPIKKKQNRSQQLDHLIELLDLEELLPKHEFSDREKRKLGKAFMDALVTQIAGHIVPGGSGQFQLPGLLKIVTKHVPAKPKRKGINPFTKQEQVFAAKPATTRVKARPMKRLKDMALQD